MNLTKRITTLITETVSSPLKTSYIIKQGDRQVVLRPGGNYSGVDLSGLDLKGLNLNKVNLRGANLVGTNLANAHLEFADLSGANLSGAVMSGTHLNGATIDTESLRNAVFEVAPAGISADSLDTLKIGG
ncbi:MAG: pentapeptide repeat-containing protein [Burkholderiales bacterium]|nr:pentapeptide repeat-containing protein [Burkholderiales bacterium]